MWVTWEAEICVKIRCKSSLRNSEILSTMLSLDASFELKLMGVDVEVRNCMYISTNDSLKLEPLGCIRM